MDFGFEVEGDVEIEAGTRRARRITSPWIIPMAAFIYVVMYVLQITVNGGFEPLSKNPAIGASDKTMVRLGGLNWEKIVHEGQTWRFYTASWLHDGLAHLIPNVVFMVVVGIPMERRLGSVRVALILTLSGMGGNVVSSLFGARGRARGGAHGALFGLLGATRSELWTNWSLVSNKRVALKKVAFSLLIDLLFIMLPSSHIYINIGGGSTGFSVGLTLLVRFCLPEYSTTKTEYKKYQRIYSKVNNVLMILGYFVGVLLHGVDYNLYDHCNWCRIHSLKWNCR